MSHLVYSLEHRWNLWLASKQSKLTKIIGYYSHDYVSPVSLLATGERHRDRGIHSVGLQEVSFHIVKASMKILVAGNVGQLPKPGGAHKSTVSKKNLRTSLKESWGKEHWQQTKWTWNPVFPQLSYQNKMQPGPHHDHSLLWPGAVCPAKPCQDSWFTEAGTLNVCFFSVSRFW